jgi:hypothetical protein
VPLSFRAGLPGPPAAWEAKFPWEAKLAKAYFRGTPYCGIHRFGRCSRYVLPRLAHEGRAPLLDVGLVEYEPSHDSERHLNRSLAPLTKAPREPPEAMGRYKWLLHLDGHSYSARLQNLLLTNAAVLKQQSMYVEYYYRALQPWEHYIPFYVTAHDDIVEVLQNVSQHDEAVRLVAHRAQAFAHATLDVDSRNCYWRRLLHGWSHRLAYRPTPDAWPTARARDGHYICGECRRPPNPALIGPWPNGHACNPLGAAGQSHTRPLADGLRRSGFESSEQDGTVRACRSAAMRAVNKGTHRSSQSK